MSPSRSGISSYRRRYRRLLLGAALAAILLPLGAVFGQEDNRISVDQVIVAEDGQGLTALVSVLDPAGQPLLGLTSFEASIDGNAVRVDSVDSVVNEGAAIAALLLMDVSRSMGGAPLAQARNAAVAFVQELRPQDVAAVAPFAHTAPSDVTFTSDRNALAAAIEALRMGEYGGTALYDALVQGLVVASRAPAAGRAIVLLTDGQDSGDLSEHARSEAVAAAAGAGVPIFAIGLGANADSAFLGDLVDAAGGRVYQAPTEAEVPGIFAAIGSMLRSRYALTLPLPRGERAERELLIAVTLDEATLTARASFEAPSAVAELDSTGAGRSLVLWSGLLLGAGLACGAVVVIARRRKRRIPVLAGGPGQVSLPPRRVNDGRETSLAPGRLTVVEGPNTGASVALAAGPIDIGSDPACALQLSGAVAGVHARGWLHGRRLMLHHLARGWQTLVRDEPIEWATLEPNEALQIGPWVIAFTIAD